MTGSDTAGGLPGRSMDLVPEDWRWATYRERTSLTHPEPKPFDQEKAAAWLAKIKFRRGGAWDWAGMRIGVSLTPEEAHFWFTAMTATPKPLRNKLVAELSKRSFDGRVTLDDARSRVAGSQMVITREMLLPLSNLLSLEDVLRLILEDDELLVHTAPAETEARRVHPSQ